MTLLLSILILSGCRGAPGPSSFPSGKSTDPAPSASSSENSIGRFSTCAATVLPNGCVRWDFKAGSVKKVSVTTEPAVPVKVLLGDTSAYVVPDGLWPDAKVTLRAKAELVSGQLMPLPDGIFTVATMGDGRSMLEESLRNVALTPHLQVHSRSGISRAPQVAWIESTWLSERNGAFEDAEEITTIRSMSRQLTTITGRRGREPWAYTVLLGDKAWQRLPGDPTFHPADAATVRMGDIMTWEPIRIMKDASAAALVRQEQVDGKSAWLMAVHTKSMLPDQSRGITTLVWLDKESKLPLRLWAVKAAWVDLKQSSGEFANWGRLDDFSYSSDPRLPVPILQFLDELSPTSADHQTTTASSTLSVVK